MNTFIKRSCIKLITIHFIGLYIVAKLNVVLSIQQFGFLQNIKEHVFNIKKYFLPANQHIKKIS